MVTAHERGWHALSDSELLDRCMVEERVLMDSTGRFVDALLPLLQQAHNQLHDRVHWL